MKRSLLGQIHLLARVDCESSRVVVVTYPQAADRRNDAAAKFDTSIQ